MPSFRQFRRRHQTMSSKRDTPESHTGDFAVVARQHRIRSNDTVEALIAALIAESSLKEDRRVIGFV